MKIRIDIQLEAQEQLDKLDRWWRKNRTAAALQVVKEYGRILGLLREEPEIGTPFTRRGVKNIRWVLMRKTPYKIYYHYEPGGEVITIVAAWSSMRKRGPKIKMP